MDSLACCSKVTGDFISLGCHPIAIQRLGSSSLYQCFEMQKAAHLKPNSLMKKNSSRKEQGLLAEFFSLCGLSFLYKKFYMSPDKNLNPS
jgi:hypothetical protein